MKIYLDYDGVLHPAEVRLAEPGYGAIAYPALDWPELELFCWAPILEGILDDFDPQGSIKIILSTSWAYQFGLEGAARYLPDGLRNRVIGRITHSMLPRGQLIANHAWLHGIEDWIALDDDIRHWPEEHRHRLVECDPWLGLSEETAVARLKTLLEDR